MTDTRSAWKNQGRMNVQFVFTTLIDSSRILTLQASLQVLGIIAT